MAKRRLETPDLERVIERWDPVDRPVHCSNCLHAKVLGAPEEPRVLCAQGHGRPRSFWMLCRAQAPLGFAAAKDCPDFTSMDDDAA